MIKSIIIPEIRRLQTELMVLTFFKQSQICCTPSSPIPAPKKDNRRMFTCYRARKLITFLMKKQSPVWVSTPSIAYSHNNTALNPTKKPNVCKKRQQPILLLFESVDF